MYLGSGIGDVVGWLSGYVLVCSCFRVGVWSGWYKTRLSDVAEGADGLRGAEHGHCLYGAPSFRMFLHVD